MATPLEKLELAESQLERVLSSLDPPDWASLSHFGFHSTEYAVDAVCIHLGIRIQKTHYAECPQHRNFTKNMVCKMYRRCWRITMKFVIVKRTGTFRHLNWMLKILQH